MSNRFGQAYGLTVLSPILNDSDEKGIARDVVLRAVLRSYNDAPESPFARVPTTHLARWTIIDEAPFESIPAKVDHFKWKYLLFTSNFDGGTDGDEVALKRYVTSLCTNIPDVLAPVYANCAEAPDVRDVDRFYAYIRRCQVKTTFLFGAYPEASVDQVLRALVAQRRVGDFIADQQDAAPSPAQLQQRFIDLAASLAAAPTPRPGTYL